MARLSVNERTIDNAIQLASKSAFYVPVKGGIVSEAQGSCLSPKPVTTQKAAEPREKGVWESSAVFF